MARILFVDDDVMTQWVMAEALRKTGYRVTSACIGYEALRLMGNGSSRFDLLITDLDLPHGMRGESLALEWRLLCPGRPTIFMGRTPLTANDWLRDHETFLQKPFQRDEILAVVRERMFQPGQVAA